jgi:hypothetical protein
MSDATKIGASPQDRQTDEGSAQTNCPVRQGRTTGSARVSAVGAEKALVRGDEALVEPDKEKQDLSHSRGDLTFDVRGGPHAGRPLDGGVRRLAGEWLHGITILPVVASVHAGC